MSALIGLEFLLLKLVRAALLALALPSTLVLAATPALALLVGVSWDSSPYVPTVWSIDPGTGQASAVGVSGQQGLNSLARDASGRLLSVSGYFLPGRLVEVDGTSGTANTLATLDLGGLAPDVRGLAVNPSGVLYALVSVYPTSENRLLTVDPITGAGAQVSSLGQASVQGLDFSPDGTLYGWSITRGLVIIDPLSGAISAVNPGYVGALNVQTLAFDLGGSLWGAGVNLYRIDRATGALTLVGVTGVSNAIRGMAFIPEPATASLLLSGLTLVATLRRRRPR